MWHYFCCCCCHFVGVTFVVFVFRNVVGGVMNYLGIPRIPQMPQRGNSIPRHDMKLQMLVAVVVVVVIVVVVFIVDNVAGGVKNPSVPPW